MAYWRMNSRVMTVMKAKRIVKNSAAYLSVSSMPEKEDVSGAVKNSVAPAPIAESSAR